MKVAAVTFANAEPLIQGLPWDVVRMIPSAMTPEVLAEFDLVLGPIAASFTNPQLSVCTAAPMIGCCGAVGSVRVDFRKDTTLESARNIALSPHSQSSNMLLRILCARAWNIDNRITLHPADEHSQRDGQLIIGDAALLTPAQETSVDLGEAWHQWTGLPFVFAGWMSQGPLSTDVAALLREVRNSNLSKVHAWSEEHSADYSLLRHFTEQLVYDNSEQQVQAIARFKEEWQHCTKASLNVA